MITDYFHVSNRTPSIHEYFEVHRSYLPRNHFKTVYDEIKQHIKKGTGSRMSCVCISKTHKKEFTLYSHPLLDWTPTIQQIRQSILQTHPGPIDYGLVHYYHDETAVINWHSDREAMNSPIYSISIGHPRRFCLRNKETQELHTFDLYDGDLFVMKVGCQDRFEHCIKSVKSFNKPRISITFRQLETPACYFLYDPISCKVSIHSDHTPNAELVYTMLPQGIQFERMVDDSEPFEPYDTTLPHLSLLKSNLQKAIRRQEKEIALHTTMKMIYHGGIIELLRRLTIITWEDTILNPYYPILVWLFVTISSKSYHVTNHDVIFIHSYVAYLCDLEDVTEYSVTYKETTPFAQLCHDTIGLSLFMRLQYGGFESEQCAMNDLIHRVLQHNAQIAQKEINMIDPYELIKVDILDASIDFHCFPSMLKQVRARLPFLSEESIRQAIWNFDSSINRRLTVAHNETEEHQWKHTIQPACAAYRAYIRNMMDN
jgi:alkylated DNA repair dioxygenase AlkB